MGAVSKALWSVGVWLQEERIDYHLSVGGLEILGFPVTLSVTMVGTDTPPPPEVGPRWLLYSEVGLDSWVAFTGGRWYRRANGWGETTPPLAWLNDIDFASQREGAVRKRDTIAA